jgi:hypothetical protein
MSSIQKTLNLATPQFHSVKNKMASMAAQLLDELMGRNRNALPTDRTKELSYNDAEVGNVRKLILNENCKKVLSIYVGV